MRLMTITMLFLVSLGSGAQTFQIQQDTGRVDLDLCQSNHQIILNKFISQAEDQASRLLAGIIYESDRNAPPFKIKSYKNILSDVLLKRMIFSALSKQLQHQKFSLFFTKKENYNKDILSTEKIELDIEPQLSTLLKKISIKRKLNLDEFELKGLSTYLLNNVIKDQIKDQAKALGKEVLKSVVVIQGGKLILRSFTLSLGKKIITSAGVGLLIDILTLPLKGSRLPPETLWTDLLNQYPSLIIMPELMKQAGINDHPWMTHCCAIQRRSRMMEKMLSRSLTLDEEKFFSSVNFIYQITDELPVTNSRPRFHFESETMRSDNTFVKPNVIPLHHIGPSWLYKLN